MDACHICRTDTLLIPHGGNRYYCTPCYIKKYKSYPITGYITYRFPLKHNNLYIRY